MDGEYEAIAIFENNRGATTSSGRHGGCKEDKDEQSSLPGCGMGSHDFSC